ncbi:MAG: hypothetical protein AAF608_05210 [Pseudomonadota bacterium]
MRFTNSFPFLTFRARSCAQILASFEQTAEELKAREAEVVAERNAVIVERDHLNDQISELGLEQDRARNTAARIAELIGV